MADEYVLKEDILKYLEKKSNISICTNTIIDKDISRAIDVLYCDIDNMVSADVQPVYRWISVDETLPVYNSRVLVYDVSKNIRIGIYTEIGWCSQYENPLIYKVTHWQPLPEPPKE